MSIGGRRIAGLLLLLLPPTGHVVLAQSFEVALSGVAATNAEVAGNRQARGLGVAGTVRMTLPRVRVEARVLHSLLRADYSIQSDYNVEQLDLTGSWFWRPYLAVQLGAGRRFISPDFVAQEVGVVRLGVLSETRLGRLAGVWLRGAYLPFSRFSGGGTAAPGFELGLGTDVGPVGARLQGFVAYEYQRIDRHAGGNAPMQTSIAQAGARLRL